MKSDPGDKGMLEGAREGLNRELALLRVARNEEDDDLKWRSMSRTFVNPKSSESSIPTVDVLR